MDQERAHATRRAARAAQCQQEWQGQIMGHSNGQAIARLSNDEGYPSDGKRARASACVCSRHLCSFSQGSQSRWPGTFPSRALRQLPAAESWHPNLRHCFPSPSPYPWVCCAWRSAHQPLHLREGRAYHRFRCTLGADCGLDVHTVPTASCAASPPLQQETKQWHHVPLRRDIASRPCWSSYLHIFLLGFGISLDFAFSFCIGVYRRAIGYSRKARGDLSISSFFLVLSIDRGSPSLHEPDGL
jgi:hypothetical protein